MRVLLAIAMLGFGIAAGSAARAADIPTGSPGTYFERGQRSEMLWLYDDQSGVVVRAYWDAPWRYHHYFPADRRPAAHRPPRKSVGRQSPDEAGENVSPFMVEQLGGSEPLCRQRAAARDAER